MSDVTIRDYDAADHDDVLRLNREAWSDTEAPEARGGMDAPDLHAIESVYLKGGAFLIAVVGGAVVGMVGLQRLSGGAFEMRRMRVALTRQGHGIGRALVDAAEAKARSLGAKRIELSTAVQQDRARRLCEAMAYKQTRTSVLQDRHGRFDVVHYAKTM